MKKNNSWKVLFLVAIVGLCLAGCAQAAGPLTKTIDGNDLGRLDSNLDYQAARELAQLQIDTIILDPTNDAWTDKSVISGSTPLFLAGIEEPSYYEFKVTTDGRDSGYVLVNINRSDLLVPQMSTDGTTVSEQLQVAAGSKNVTIYRYNYRDYVAESNATRSLGQPVAIRGYAGVKSLTGTRSSGFDSENYRESKKRFSTAVREEGCNPQYSRTTLDAYYADLDRQTRAPETIKSKTVYLKNIFVTGTGKRTADYTQPLLPNGVNVTGCGPTAWSIVYAYWFRFKGKTNLFNGTTENLPEVQYGDDTGIVRDVQDEIGKIVRRYYVSGGTAVHPDDMPRGERYGQRYGYSTSSHQQWAYSIWDHHPAASFVYKEISGDRPVICTMDLDSSIFEIMPDHYLVVEAIKKKYVKESGDIKEARLLLNYGWGSYPREWIYYYTDVSGRSTKNFWDFYSLRF
jgi:hypothetical protein